MTVSSLRLSFAVLMLGFAAFQTGAAEPPVTEQSADATETSELSRQIQSAKPEDRAAAILAILDLDNGACELLPNLRTALQDSDANVRAVAAHALGRLARDPEQTVPALVVALQDEGQSEYGPVWLVAGQALGRFGQSAVPQLRECLQSEKVCVVRGALAGIADAGAAAKQSVPDLIDVLKEDNDQTRNFALNAIIGIGPSAKRAVPICTELLRHENFHTRYWTCRALGSIGEQALPARDELICVLENDVASGRHNAAEALGKIGPAIGKTGADALTKALSDYSQIVRQKAVIALGKLGDLARPAIPEIEQRVQDAAERLDAWKRFRPLAPAVRTLWNLQPDSPLVLECLLCDLRENNEPWPAIAVLGEIGDSIRAVEPLQAMLQEEKWPTRENAAAALGAMGRKARGAVPALERLRDDPNDQVRQAVEEALRSIAEDSPGSSGDSEAPP